MNKSEQVISAAEAIKQYLIKRPNASETVDGVAKWWLVRQRYDDSVELVQKALDYLESHGEVIRVQLKGGKVLYRKSILENKVYH